MKKGLFLIILLLVSWFANAQSNTPGDTTTMKAYIDSILNENRGVIKRAYHIDILKWMTRYVDSVDRAKVITGKLNISDTAAMLTPYISRGDTASAFAPFIERSDTATMLSTYTRYAEFVDTAAALRTDIGSATATDNIVSMPSQITYQPPFAIYYDAPSTTYDISSSFNLQRHADINPVNTYYVSLSGNDANDGLSWGNAVQSIDQAITLANAAAVASRIYIAKGYYTKQYSWDNLIPTVALEVIGDFSQGTGDSIYITKDIRDEVVGSWGAKNNYDSISIATAPTAVIDDSQLDSYGHRRYLIERASVSEVNGTAGSWYHDGSTLYVRQWDDTAPTSEIRIIDGLVPNIRLRNNFHYYFKNIHTVGSGIHFIANDADGGRGLYIDSCTIQGGATTIHGIEESLIFNSTFRSSAGADHINYDVASGIITNAVEWNLNISNTAQAGNSETSAQASTSHNSCQIIRIQGYYANTNGDNVADVTGTKSYNLGCTFNDALVGSGSGYLAGTGSPQSVAYLDDCTFTNQDNNDINAATNSIIYTREITASGAGNTATGTITSFNRVFSDSIPAAIIAGVDGISTDTTFNNESDRQLPSEKAVKTYVNNQIAAISIPDAFPTGTAGQTVTYNSNANPYATSFLFIDSTNSRLGLGTASPAELFEAETSTGNGYFLFDVKASGQEVGIKLDDGASQRWTIGTSNTNNSGSLNITATNALGSGTRVVLSRTGNLGIGIGNTAPSYKLDVDGSVGLGTEALVIDTDSSYHPRNVQTNVATKTIVPADFGKKYFVGTSATYTFNADSDAGLEVGDFIEFIRMDGATVTIATSGATMEFSDNTNSSSFTINESGTIYYKGANEFLFIGN